MEKPGIVLACLQVGWARVSESLGQANLLAKLMESQMRYRLHLQRGPPHSWSSEGTESVCRPFRKTAWVSSSLWLTHPQSSLVFTARSYRDSSSQPWNPGLGTR